MGKSINNFDFKAGIRREDFQNAAKSLGDDKLAAKLISIFNQVDDGNGVIDSKEQQKIMNAINQVAAKDGNAAELTSKEAKGFMKAFGDKIKGHFKGKDILSFIKAMQIASNQVESAHIEGDYERYMYADDTTWSNRITNTVKFSDGTETSYGKVKGYDKPQVVGGIAVKEKTGEKIKFRMEYFFAENGKKMYTYIPEDGGQYVYKRDENGKDILVRSFEETDEYVVSRDYEENTVTYDYKDGVRNVYGKVEGFDELQLISGRNENNQEYDVEYINGQAVYHYLNEN